MPPTSTTAVTAITLNDLNWDSGETLEPRVFRRRNSTFSAPFNRDYNGAPATRPQTTCIARVRTHDVHLPSGGRPATHRMHKAARDRTRSEVLGNDVPVDHPAGQ
jgi:hypothetical protein